MLKTALPPSGVPRTCHRGAPIGASPFRTRPLPAGRLIAPTEGEMMEAVTAGAGSVPWMVYFPTLP